MNNSLLMVIPLIRYFHKMLKLLDISCRGLQDTINRAHCNVCDDIKLSDLPRQARS